MKCGIKNRSLLAGLIILGFLGFIALFAAWLVPHDPEAINLDLRLTPPNSEYPFGTDHLGRCVLSRVLFASRISLLIGFSVVMLSLFIGTAVGTTAGYFGGFADEVLMRLVDGFLAFPSMFLALAIVGLFGGSLTNLVLALVLVEWTGYARVVRASVLTVKNREFVTVAKGFGGSDLYVIIRHVLPHASSPLLVMGTLGIGYVILASAGLSFLGFGVQTLPEWGAMLNDGRYFLRTAPYLMIFPGLSIMFTVLGFNFLGDGLRDCMDPKSKQGKESL
ncbi:Oligopeptide transport system permease protein OppC [Methanosarcina sp. MTP4]|uniref:ABC transporter permease n=1 Tax=Methanosarcina sp. MTP4 TaxID=1434100 RepID=UPI000615919F|nr:ABC transporter permease [Methanosarcina sp. MTP4]AKB23818.1 Oligopeptide transport system permease protein OppC [Methanosarcina sp. MTP4]